MDASSADGRTKGEQSDVKRFYPAQQDVEMILMEGRPSLAPPLIIIAVLGSIALISAITLLLFLSGLNIPFILMSAAWLVCLVVIGVQGGLEIVQRLNTRFVLTQKNLYIKRGIVRLWHKTLVVSRIQDVVVEQGPLARAFHYGSLRVETAGERGGLVLNDVPTPLAWRASILLAIAHATRGRIKTGYPN